MRNKLTLAVLLTAMAPLSCQAFTFSLSGGAFYGPGDKGVHPFEDGALNNFIPTGPMSGYIPFFNNGPALPNVNERLQVGGIVDGRISTGVLINENLNTAFVINTNDPKNGFVSMFVTGVAGGPLGGQEVFEPDAKGNLTLKVDIVFDPGIAELAVPLQVNPTTGAVRVPLSRKTQMGEPGGNDIAGIYPSGRVVIGHLGDYDQNGFLDGEFVLSESAPLNLIVAEGDPVAFSRGFTSDLPLAPIDAALATAGSIVANFPEPMGETAAKGELEVLQDYVYNIDDRLYAATENTRRVDTDACRSLRDELVARFALKQARKLLTRSRDSFFAAGAAFDEGEKDRGEARLRKAFSQVGSALQYMATARERLGT